MGAHAAEIDTHEAGDLVAARFEQRVRDWEAACLSPLATLSYPARRGREEEPCRLRTPFQRDRDRIVHSKSFRRLKHKAQVFIAPEGDHYRTRLTHTLEACGISRGVARALRLNEDLTEAIGLGHDLGHPPFGHAGEEALDAALREKVGRRFLHNHHSLRVVEVLERDGKGLNLTEPVRDGILRHTGDELPATLEGRIVRLVDRIAYVNHDIDDALRAGLISEGDLPRDEIGMLGRTGSERIDRLVHDLVERSERAGEIVQSEGVGRAMARLREFMFERVYLAKPARHEQARVSRVIRALFDYYMGNPRAMSPDRESGAPAREASGTGAAGRTDDLATRVTDYIAGMTDRFCIRAFEQVAVPREFPF